MKKESLRSADQILATRQQLESLKAKAPESLKAFVIDIALSYKDPLDFWWEYHCKIGEVVEELDLSSFVQRHEEELIEIRHKHFDASLDHMHFGIDFLLHFTFEFISLGLESELKD